MGKILIIAEKPSVARDIGRVLNCGQTGNGFIQNDEYIISWAIGHLIVLCEPEDYDVKYKKWDYATLPILPDQIKLKPAKATDSQFRILKKLMNSKEVDSIVCATDSGREGELIFRYIYNYAGCKKPFKRLWISSMTDQAIRDGLNNLRNGSDYDNLYLSAKSRSEADWLVGINATRAYTVQYNTLLSIGRVQTPTLALLVERQKKIDEFKPVEYWEVEAQYKEFSGMWFKAAASDPSNSDKTESEETRIKSREQAQAIAKKVHGQMGAVIKKETETKKNPPPLLYDLTELQRDGNKRFGFSAQKTLSIAQDLYEKRKMITYPRTDSRYLSGDYVPKIHSTLNALEIEEYAEFVKRVKELPKLPITKRIVDDTKITDHHAIVPTDVRINLRALSADELKIYDLIARRFISVFYPAYIYNITKITVEILEETFLSKGSIIVQLGWMEVSPSSKEGKDEKEKPLPNIEKGDEVTALDTKVLQKKTQPPKLYNEATLLSAMENAGRLVENEDLKEQMKDSGLGTPATRAAIIERLISVGYIERKAKSLIVTEKAKGLIELVPDALKIPETTGKWEKGLSSIAQGKMSDKKFMTSITNYVQFLVNDSKNKKAVTFKQEERRSNSKKPPREEIGVCPACGKGNVMENTKGYYCGRWREGCSFTIWKNCLAQYGGTINSGMVAILIRGNEIQGLELILPQTHEKGTATLILREDNSGAVELKNFTRKQ